MRLWIRGAILIVMVMVFAACGGGDDESDNQPSGLSLEVTVPPVQAMSIVEGCSEEVVDDWGDQVYSGLITIVDETEAYIEGAADGRRNEVLNLWQELIDRRAAISEQPTPSCLAETQERAIALLQGVIVDVQRFANAEISANTLRQDVQPDIDALRDLIDAFSDLREEIVIDS